MQIIDIHTHVYPDEIAQKAADSVQDFYGMGERTMDGTVDMLLRRGAEAGISHYVILPVAIRPDRAQGINDFIVRQVAAHKELFGFGTVHAAMDDPAAEAQRVRDMGLLGIKMHPDSQQFPIDDPRLFPMYEAMQGQFPVIFHMGDLRYDYSHPARLRRLLDLFPRLDVIAAHFGGYQMYETAYELLRDTDCIFDISSSLMLMPDGVPEKFIGLYGAERMAYGTDYPMWDPVREVPRFLGLKLPEAEIEQIAWKTAARFLNLDI